MNVCILNGLNQPQHLPALPIGRHTPRPNYASPRPPETCNKCREDNSYTDAEIAKPADEGHHSQIDVRGYENGRHSKY